jgi:tripartite-type tricarboxylate transporter receptor subunit TctC
MKASRVINRRQILIAASSVFGLQEAALSQTDSSISAANSKPLFLIVPFAAGGPTDVMARAYANVLSEKTARQVIVENKPGAGGNIAANYALGFPADGSRLLVAGQAIMAINKSLYGKLNFDPEKDFSWIGMMGSLPNVLLINPSVLPVKNIQELTSYLKQHPGEIAYGSNGIGSLTHLCTEVFLSTASSSMIHIPYQGVAPQISDLLSGRIALSLAAASSALPLVKGGKLKALAVSSRTRMKNLAEVPTLLESGFPMLDVPVWFSVVAPSNTPSAILQQLRSDMSVALNDVRYESELIKQEGQLIHMSPEQAQEMLTRERKIWSEAVLKTHASAS